MLIRRILGVLLLISGLTTNPVFAQQTQPSQASSPTPVPSAPATKPADKKPLDEKEDPLLIGKRNINKHQIDFYSLEKEVALGQQLAGQVNEQAEFIDDSAISEYVNRVGQNIVLHSDAKVPFTIKVIKSDDVNAFALPGGFFFVNSGLILAADNEAEIVGVMAHEIAHVAARHGVEQASKGTLANLAMVPLIFMTGGLAQIAYQGVQLTLPLAFLKFTRGMEAEADMLGAEYAWAAGYDPYALITFFEKIQKKEKSKPGTLAKIFGSHPPTSDRIKAVKDLLARFPERNEYTIDSSEFKRVKGSLLEQINEVHGVTDGVKGNEHPTLKRRKEGTDPNAPPTTEDKKDGKDKPTLKRKDSDGKPADKPPQFIY